MEKPRPANEVVVVTLDGKRFVATEAPGEVANGPAHRARRIAEKPDHVWVCRDGPSVVVIPPHAVARVWVQPV